MNYLELPKAYGARRDGYVTLNPRVSSMGFSGVSVILFPLNQELFDKLGRSIEGDWFALNPEDLVFMDAFNNEINTYCKIKFPLLTITDRFGFKMKLLYEGKFMETKVSWTSYGADINPTEFM